MDYTTLTDDELIAIRRDVTVEQERRANLARIPEQIATLTQTYIDGGGDPADLTPEEA